MVPRRSWWLGSLQAGAACCVGPCGQPQEGDADLGLVLHPDYWGSGKIIYEEIIRRAFGEMGLKSVTILFPPTRTRIKGILRLGFKPDGEVEIGGEPFIRYRLYAPQVPEGV